MRHGRRVLLGLGLLLTACNEGCWWTDPNNPEPGPVMRLGVAYPTDGAQFEVTLESPDGTWPPTGDPFALDVVVAPTGDAVPTDVGAETPAFEDGDLAQSAPAVAQIEPNTRWRLDPLALDIPGVWEIPLTIDTLGEGDQLALRLRVEE